jgi:hypothetical protein
MATRAEGRLATIGRRRCAHVRPSTEETAMARMPRIVAIVSIVAGAVMLVLGVVTYSLVYRELGDQKIVVSDDAQHNAGKDVKGPFTAYSQAMAIKTHALEIGGGKTYAELPQDDPDRDTVMTASFLQASLFTSVVAFGVAALVAGLGVLFILFGLALMGVQRRLDMIEHASPTPDDTATVTTSPAAP